MNLDANSYSTASLPNPIKSSLDVTTLPVSLLGHCCLFLNLKELHATHSVSHTFHAATLSEAAWNENCTLPSFHHTTFPSPRIQLRSSTPLIKLAAIRSSPHSFGRSGRCMEVTTTVHKFGDIQQLIEPESRNLDCLIIRKGLTSRSLTRIDVSSSTKNESINPTTIHPSIPMSFLRVLFMGNVHELFLAALLPIIRSMHSLEILELELYAPKVCPAVFSLTAGFAVSLGQLKSLHTLILSDPAYRRIANGERSLKDSKILVLSASSLEELIQLEGCTTGLKRIELCVLLGCCTKCYEVGCLPSAPLVSVTTLAIATMDFTPLTVKKIFSFFPNLTAVIDCSSESDWTVFTLLPASVVELTVSHLRFGDQVSSHESHSTPTGSLRRLHVHRLTCHYFQHDSRRLVDQHLRAALHQVEEFYYNSLNLIHTSNMPLYQFMPRIKIGRLAWSNQYERTFRWSELRHVFGKQFPLANKLHILCDPHVALEGKFRSAYEAREVLRAIPHLKEVKWNDEPWLTLDYIESYYSWANIDQRQKQRLNLDQLDHIQPVLHRINTSPLPHTVNLNLLSLTLIFQFLTPLDLFSAHRVCRSYRVAAVSPLVLRPNIRVRMDHKKGMIVSGTQVSFTSIQPMLSAVRSMLFQNIRILTLPPPLDSAIQSLPRPPDFYHYHLDRFELIPFFHSLHTLVLDWSPTSTDAPTITEADHGLIDRVFQSAALKHLKVLHLRMSSALLTLLVTNYLSHLRELEVVQLYSTQRHLNEIFSLNQLGTLKTLKQAVVDCDRKTTTHRDLTKLLEFIRASDSIESIHWLPTIENDLIQEWPRTPDDVPRFIHVHSITVAPIFNHGLSCLDTIVWMFPDLRILTLSIQGRSVPDSSPPPSFTLPIQLCQQLRVLNISCVDPPSTMIVLEQLSQSVQGVVWSRLERFGLFGSLKIHGSYAFSPPQPAQSITTILRSMTHLKELVIEGIQFSLDLDPDPWLGRLTHFEHSDLNQLIRLLPHAHRLIQLRTRLDFKSVYGLLGPILLNHSQLRGIVFDERHLTRNDLIQRQTPTRRTLLSPPKHQTNKSINQQEPNSNTLTCFNPCSQSPISASIIPTHSRSTEALAADPSSSGSDQSTHRGITTDPTIGPHQPVESVDQLEEIFMELVASLQTTRSRGDHKKFE